MDTAAQALNHVGLTVPHIFDAIDWYQSVLGCRHVMGPRILTPAAGATHETASILGPRFGVAYQAHLLTPNGIGLELFEFVDPPVQRRADNFEYWMQGVWHLCFTAADIEAKVAEIVRSGGRQRGPVFEFVPGRPFKLVYCEDPFGNVIELFSHGYAEVFGRWPQPGMTAPTAWLDREEHRRRRKTAGASPDSLDKG